MKLSLLILPGCMFFLSLNAYSATYRYVDRGMVCYTDDLGKVPTKQRKSAVNLDDNGVVTETAATSLAPGNGLDGLGIAELEKAARSGDIRAQNKLGYRYVGGIGVPRNDERARYWFALCAKSGDASCQSNMASMIMTGRGGGLPFSEGMKWLKSAADQGDPQAQYNLGREYKLGFKVKQNLSEALVYYSKAADQEFEEAMVNLGNMYLEGDGVEKNVAKAKKLFEKAANLGNSVAIDNLSILNGTTKYYSR